MTSQRLAWYLLIHQLPPRPLYLRAKIRRNLARAGAAALKSSVYALPSREECRRRFAAIARDAVEGGGEAYVCEASFVDRAADAELLERFQRDRDAEYRELAERLDAAGPSALPRARRRLEEIARVDWFGAPGKAAVERRIEALQAGVRRKRRDSGTRDAGRTWFTRRGLLIDRLACAWLIRRFLDRDARFRFGDANEPRREDEVSFDLHGGDFAHEGDRCTFETLAARHSLRDRALSQVGEIVHDVDMKDGKFGRPEAAGVERVVAGIVAGAPNDDARLERGLAFFEDLYRSFAGSAAAVAAAPATRRKR